jgi:hypothetical protein
MNTNTPPKSLEEQLADANAEIAKLKATQAPADATPSAAATNGSPAGDVSGNQSPTTTPAPTIQAAAPTAAPANIIPIAAPPAPENNSGKEDIKALEAKVDALTSAVAKLSTDQHIAGAENIPVGSNSSEGNIPGNSAPSNLTGIEAVEASFSKDLENLGIK